MRGSELGEGMGYIMAHLFVGAGGAKYQCPTPVSAPYSFLVVEESFLLLFILISSFFSHFLLFFGCGASIPALCLLSFTRHSHIFPTPLLAFQLYLVMEKFPSQAHVCLTQTPLLLQLMILD